MPLVLCQILHWFIWVTNPIIRPVDFKSSKPHKNMTTDNVKQGPMRLVDLMDRLATEDNVSRDFAAKNGRHGTDAYYRAWQWCVAVCLNNPRPELTWNAEKAMHRIQMSPRDLYGFRQYWLTGENFSPYFTFLFPNFKMKQFDTIAKMSTGALLTILVCVGGQYILNNNAKDKCRLNPRLNLIYMDTFIGDSFACRSYLGWHLKHTEELKLNNPLPLFVRGKRLNSSWNTGGLFTL